METAKKMLLDTNMKNFEIADKVGFSSDLIVCGVDIYPEIWNVLDPEDHICGALDAAEDVRGFKTNRETWVVEMPGGFCREDTGKQLNWIQTAIDYGATAIGLYEIVEKEHYKSSFGFGTIACRNAYGIVNKNGCIYYSNSDNTNDDIDLDDHDYYMLVAHFCGVKYNAIEDYDSDAKMIFSAAFGAATPIWV